MSARKAGDATLPDFLKHPPMGEGHVLKAEGIANRSAA